MRFEVAVPGVPRAYRAASCPAWQAQVRAAATLVWPLGRPAYEDELSVALVYFHFDATTIDLRNMAKPILDALIRLTYIDDGQITQMTVRKTRISSPTIVREPTGVLAAALVQAWESRRGFVYLSKAMHPTMERCHECLD